MTKAERSSSPSDDGFPARGIAAMSKIQHGLRLRVHCPLLRAKASECLFMAGLGSDGLERPRNRSILEEIRTPFRFKKRGWRKSLTRFFPPSFGCGFRAKNGGGLGELGGRHPGGPGSTAIGLLVRKRIRSNCEWTARHTTGEDACREKESVGPMVLGLGLKLFIPTELAIVGAVTGQLSCLATE